MMATLKGWDLLCRNHRATVGAARTRIEVAARKICRRPDPKPGLIAELNKARSEFARIKEGVEACEICKMT